MDNPSSFIDGNLHRDVAGLFCEGDWLRRSYRLADLVAAENNGYVRGLRRALREISELTCEALEDLDAQ